MLIRAAALAGCLATAVVLRLPWLGAPADRDPGVYMTIAEHLGWQTLPYRELFDHKQPLIYPFYWVIAKVLPTDMDSLRITSAILAGLAAYLVFHVLWSLVDAWRAALATAVVLVAGASVYVVGGDLNVEHLALPLTVAAVLIPLALREHPGWWVPVAAGLLAAVPALMKVSMLPGLLAGVIPLVMCRAARGQSVVRTLALYAGGLAAPVLAVVVFFAGRGAFDELVDANWTFNRRYADIIVGDDRWDRLWSHEELWWLAAGAAAVGLVRLVATRSVRDVPAITFLAWLMGTAIGIALPGPAFPHYFVQLVPPAACLLALAPPRLDPRAAAAVTAVLTAVLVWPFVREDVRAFGYEEGEISERLYGDVQFHLWSQYEPVGKAIRARARPGDRLYVGESEPAFYWYSGVRPASRVLFENSFRVKPELRDEVIRGLCRFPPRFVVLPFENWPAHLACLRDLDVYKEILRRRTVVVMERPPGALDLGPAP